jgi:SprT protein
MTVVVQEQILMQCHSVFRRANSLFPHLNFKQVEIKFNLKGHQAGQARRDWGEYSVRFNNEYAVYDLQHILSDTVPHEIAHLACFMDERLGKNHNSGWKKLCVDLGGTAQTTHPIPKVFCKGRTFQYVTTTGKEVRVSEHMHNKIQAGAAYRYSKAEGDVHRGCLYTVV